MKIKYLSVIVSYFILSFTLASCLDSDDETTIYSQEAAISSFAINDIKTIINNGRDTLTQTVSGNKYPFVIDQLNGLIYNPDSLPKGTDVKKVSLSIIATGTVFYKKNGVDTLWASTDSLNFTQAANRESALEFIVHAADWETIKTYKVWINIHKQAPDSLIWRPVQGAEFPGTAITEGQKAVLFNQKIFVFGQTGGQVKVTSANVTDGRTWTAPAELDIPETADYSSVMVFQDKILILASGKLYSSADGFYWTRENAPAPLSGLVAYFNDKLIAVHENNFVETADFSTWKETGLLPEEFPLRNYSSVSYPLASNPALKKLILIGTPVNPVAITTPVWSMLSDENNWSPYIPDQDNSYGCPALENISLIHYDNNLYVFGGQGIDNGTELKPFQYFYSSQDEGLTWQPVKRQVIFPAAFTTFGSNYSFIIDDEHYIWLMWSGRNEIWKGRINRLGFTKQ